MRRALLYLWYRRDEGALAKLLLFPLWVLSLVFGLLVRVRTTRYARPGASRKVSARVISVGNLTVGGAGKTPVVIHLAQRLVAAKEPVAVLSRGYRGTGSKAPIIVSDGGNVLSTAETAGDEPFLVARSCQGVPVVVGPDRCELADLAISRFGARTLLLDDGFQHLGLARDLDIVVVEAGNPFGNGHLLPRGPLRESREALSRAGLVWLGKRRPEGENAADLASLLREAREKTGREPVTSTYRVVDVCGPSLGSLGHGFLAGKRVLLCAGIARPGSFRATLLASGASVVGEAVFADHHRFTRDEIGRVAERARQIGADVIAMTEKDAVRLPIGCADATIGVVRIAVEISSGEEQLAEVLRR
jgi:tetraacyldisaccharide 4'-kinase